MGRFEVADFVLLVHSDAISGERTLEEVYEAIASVKEVLMDLRGRPFGGFSKSACP
jgi:hypothetical protein